MNALFRNRVAIERKPDPSQLVPSAAGDVAPVYETITNDVACRIEPRSGDYRQREYGQQQAVTHRGFFGVSTDIQVGDRVVEGDSRFLVTFIAERAGYRAHHYEADLSLLVATL